VSDSGYRNLCKIGGGAVRTILCSSLIYIGKRVSASTKSHPQALKKYTIKISVDLDLNRAIF